MASSNPYCCPPSYLGNNPEKMATHSESVYARTVTLIACDGCVTNLTSKTVTANEVTAKSVVVELAEGETPPESGKLLEVHGDVYVSGVIDPTGIQLTVPPGNSVPRRQDGTDTEYSNTPDQGLLFVSQDGQASFSNTLVYLDGSNTEHVLGDAVAPVGPVADNAVVRFDSTSGKQMQSSGMVLDDTNVLNTAGDAGMTAVGGDITLTADHVNLNGFVINPSGDVPGLLLSEQSSNPYFLTQTDTQGVFYVKEAAYGGIYTDNHPMFVQGDLARTESVVGNLVGPAGGGVSVDGLARFDDAAGTLVKGSSVTLSDTNEFAAAVGDLSFTAAAGDINVSTAADKRIVLNAKTLMVNGDVSVTGTTFTTNSETLNVLDNYVYVNNGWTMPFYKSGGIVVNYLPTSTVVSITGPFTAGAGPTKPSVVVTAGGIFSPGDLVQISGSVSSTNNGLFEVEDNSTTTLYIRDSSNAIDFVQNQFETDVSTPYTGEVRKVTVSTISPDASGRPVRRHGSNTLDASIVNAKHFIVSATAGTGIGIDLTDPTVPVISSTITPVNDDVQVTAVAGGHEVSVGKSADVGAGSLVFAGQTDYSTSSIGTNSVVIGEGATAIDGGNFTERVAIGYDSGRVAGADNTVAVGSNAGKFGQGSCSVAIGCQAGEGTADLLNSQGTQAVAIGRFCGQTKQGTSSVAVGYNCGNLNQAGNSVAIGYEAAKNNQSNGSVAIGSLCADTSQGQYCVAIGQETARASQANFSIAIGRRAGTLGTGISSIAIGNGCAGDQAAAQNSVAIGAGCLAPLVQGRLAFGSGMESPTTIATTSVEDPTGLLNLEWNGTAYRLPLLSSTATKLRIPRSYMHAYNVAIQQNVGDVIHFNDVTTSITGVKLFRVPKNATIESVVVYPGEQGYCSIPANLNGGFLYVKVLTYPDDTDPQNLFGSVTSNTNLGIIAHSDINTAAKNYAALTFTPAYSLTAGQSYGYYIQNNLTNTSTRPTFYNAEVSILITET